MDEYFAFVYTHYLHHYILVYAFTIFFPFCAISHTSFNVIYVGI